MEGAGGTAPPSGDSKSPVLLLNDTPIFGGPPRYRAEFLRLRAGSFTIKACRPSMSNPANWGYATKAHLTNFLPPLNVTGIWSRGLESNQRGWVCNPPPIPLATAT